GAGSLDHTESRLLRDRLGRFYILENYPTALKLHDSSGKFQRLIGREGSGPGEFRGIGAVVFGTADSVFLFDNMSSRMTVLGPDFEFGRSAVLAMPPEQQAIQLSSAEFVLGVPIH